MSHDKALYKSTYTYLLTSGNAASEKAQTQEGELEALEGWARPWTQPPPAGLLHILNSYPEPESCKKDPRSVRVLFRSMGSVRLETNFSARRRLGGGGRLPIDPRGRNTMPS